MLKVECESCKAPYQVDERRVPATGLKMRCPKCGHTFLVTDPSKGAPPPAAAPATPAAPPTKKATMVGLSPNAKSGGAGAPPALPGLDFDASLPAVKPAPPRGASAAKPAPPAPAAPPAFPGLEDLDFPALAGDVGLPAPAKRAPERKGAPPAPAAPPPFNLDVDLPAVPAPRPAGPAAAPPAHEGLDLPAVKPAGGFGDLPMAKGGATDFGDLPSPKGGGFGDLPMAKPGGGFGDLPMAKPGAGGFGDLPAPKAGGGFGDLPMAKPGGGFGDLPAPKAGGGFGEIDLPSLQNDLPLYGGGNLPAPAAPGAHLPAPAGADAHLPSPMRADAHLPSPMMGGGTHLPSLGPEQTSNKPPAAFGELDLPLVSDGGGDFRDAPPPPRSAAGGGFGEVDLPSGPPGALSPSLPPISGAGGAGAGGMAFGEVDLGGGSSGASEPPIGPPPAASAGAFAFQEASLESTTGGPEAAAGPGRPAATPRPSSKLPKVIGAALVVLVVGGAALQLTPLGAFGYVAIGDKLHAGDHAADALARADDARKKLAVDTFAVSLKTADDLVEARKRAPRSRPLGAYAAFAEYMNQVRFGADPARAARVSTFLTEIPPDKPVHYQAAAIAAQLAQSGDWVKAKAAVDNAVAKEPKDGIQQELSILKGEIALGQKDPAGALAAFTAAQASGATARTSFGVARAHYLARAYTKAREAVDQTLKASPSHAGALTLRAQLAWELQRDEIAATKDLDAVLEEKNRKLLGTGELSYALSTKGAIAFARERTVDARAAFDEAVKVDPRNVNALVGQGEMLYADGRYTEALTRFDEAMTKDASSIPAMLGSAKAKVALERLADAKTLLTSARQKAPKDMGVALWLAKTEEALGNKKGADELFNAAIDLTDSQHPDAVQAYAGYARFLASQGKSAEAATKIEQAREKLPDTPTLRRALGELAAAQGQFAEALENFEAALQKNPSDLGTRFRLGVTYRQMHKLDLAARALDEVAAIDKEYPGLALERGKLFEESGDVQKALEQFKSASQKDPNDVDLMLRVGAAYVAIGDVEAALPILNKVRDKRPNSAEVNHFVGRAYLKHGVVEAQNALRYLRRAVELDPNKAEYHLYVAWAANESTPAQLGLARTEVEKALSLDKLLADAYWQRGVLLQKEGVLNDAIKDLKRALELKPSRHEAHATLAEVYEQKNDLTSAMAEWQKAIAGDDKPADWRWRYGKILAERRQSAEAAKHLAYAVQQGKSAQPRPGWLAAAAFEAGEALHKVGQKKEACEHYQIYLELASTTDPDRRDANKAVTELACPPPEGR